ncbi:hypothetical protein OG196_19615 [Kitasatospora purpeofusca]|uniref:hypothetical protein n=1 Tax=Kitasatospora purpeofusca TaxID=67352 RepID=UPI002E12E491|nr:hypothetical protein OG196_19615 [Kitasatospora purpeofusca]
MSPDQSGDHEDAPEAAAQDAVDQDVPEAWEAFEQLRSLAPHLFAQPGNLLRDASVAGDLVGGDKYSGVHLHARLGRERITSGSVSSDQLQVVASGFSPTRRYDEAHGRLQSDPVLILRGQRGSGRRTAAIRLLDQLTAARVVMIDPDTEPDSLGELLRPGHGHLIADPLTGRNAPLRDVHIHAMRQHLRQYGGFLVITAETDIVLDSASILDWEAPEAGQVVRAHLETLLDAAPEPSDANSAELLKLPEVSAYLMSRPTPKEAAGFARLLHAYATGRVPSEALTDHGRAAAEAVVDEWFRAEGPHLRDKAFLLALAVLERSPYPLVAERGDQLFRLFHAVEAPSDPAGLTVFGASRASRLTTARAYEYAGTITSPWGALPQTLVAFRDSNLWATVLTYVWTTHPAARNPVVHWLVELGSDPSATVRLRSAVGVGTIALADFPHSVERFLSPWAASPQLRQRQQAAWALAATFQGGQPGLVRRLLSRWSQEGSPGRRWTAARTHALIGSAVPGAALRDLAQIVGSVDRHDPTTDRVQGQLFSAVTQTLESLLLDTAAPTVMSALHSWCRQGISSHRKAAQEAFLRACASRHDEPAAEGGLPRLLRLAVTVPSVRPDFVALWKAVLADREHRQGGQAVLGRWIGAADFHAELLEVLSELLPALVTTQNDAERLDYLVRRAPRPDQAAPGRRTSPTGTAPSPADRLRHALANARPGHTPQLGWTGRPG